MMQELGKPGNNEILDDLDGVGDGGAFLGTEYNSQLEPYFAKVAEEKAKIAAASGSNELRVEES